MGFPENYDYDCIDYADYGLEQFGFKKKVNFKCSLGNLRDTFGLDGEVENLFRQIYVAEYNAAQSVMRNLVANHGSMSEKQVNGEIDIALWLAMQSGRHELMGRI